MSSSPQAYLEESRADTLRVILWTFFTLASISVTMRCYVRVFLKRAFGIDDVCASVATALLLAYAVMTELATQKGMGRHIEFIEQRRPQDLVAVGLLNQVALPFAIMACTIGKTSFTLTLLRVGGQRWLQVVLWVIMVTMNGVNVASIILQFAQCSDPRSLYDASVVSKCLPAAVYTDFCVFVGAYSCLQDFVLAMLPWAIIWRLNMRTQEKLGIAISMSLGVFAGAASIVKTTYLTQLSNPDFTWGLGPLLWWAGAEDGLAIVASSLPALRPLLRHLRTSPSDKEGPQDGIGMFNPLGDVPHLEPPGPTRGRYRRGFAARFPGSSILSNLSAALDTRHESREDDQGLVQLEHYFVNDDDNLKYFDNVKTVQTGVV